MAIDLINKWYPAKTESIQSAALGVPCGIGLAKLFTFKKEPGLLPKDSRGDMVFKNVQRAQYGRATASALATCIAFPVLEECVYRGYVYPLNEKLTPLNKTKEIAKSSVIFAAVHIDPVALVKTPTPYLKEAARFMPRLFIAGTAFCALADWTGDLVAPTAAHMTCNTTQMLNETFKKAKLRK